MRDFWIDLNIQIFICNILLYVELFEDVCLILFIKERYR
jgi:hypothetical protein